MVHLPNELLLLVTGMLEKARDVSAISRTSHGLYALLSPYLYGRDFEKEKSDGLLWAAENGREAAVRSLLRSETCIEMDSNARTPLAFAAKGNHKSIVTLFLADDRFDPNARDRDGLTPLSLAAQFGAEAVVRLLLTDERVEVNVRCLSRTTSLAHAAKSGHEGVVRVLCADKRIDLELRDFPGKTALFHAVEQGHREVVKVLFVGSRC